MDDPCDPGPPGYSILDGDVGVAVVPGYFIPRGGGLNCGGSGLRCWVGNLSDDFILCTLLSPADAVDLGILSFDAVLPTLCTVPADALPPLPSASPSPF